MDFDQLLIRYFGTDNVAGLAPEQLADGVGQLRIYLGLERNRGRRFALWSLLYMLGSAPDLDVVFKEKADQEAARDFMDRVHRADPDSN